MKCHVHYDRDAVATCVSCNRGLCSECANTFTRPSCADCVRQHYAGMMAEKRKPIIWTIAVIVGGFLTGMSIGEASQPMQGGLLISILFLSIYWGWAFVKPMLFATLFGTIVWKSQGLFIGMFLVGLAMCLGLIVGPFAFGKNVFDYYTNKRNLAMLSA